MKQANCMRWNTLAAFVMSCYKFMIFALDNWERFKINIARKLLKTSRNTMCLHCTPNIHRLILLHFHFIGAYNCTSWNWSQRSKVFCSVLSLGAEELVKRDFVFFEGQLSYIFLSTFVVIENFPNLAVFYKDFVFEWSACKIIFEFCKLVESFTFVDVSGCKWNVITGVIYVYVQNIKCFIINLLRPHI